MSAPEFCMKQLNLILFICEFTRLSCMSLDMTLKPHTWGYIIFVWMHLYMLATIRSYINFGAQFESLKFL